MEVRYVRGAVVHDTPAFFILVIDGDPGGFVELDVVSLEVIERIVAGDDDGVSVDLAGGIQRLVETGFEPDLLLARRETVLVVEMDAVQSDDPYLRRFEIFQPEAGFVKRTGRIVIPFRHRDPEVVDIIGEEGIEIPGLSHIIPVCGSLLVTFVIRSEGPVVVPEHEEGFLGETRPAPPLGVVGVLFSSLSII